MPFYPEQESDSNLPPSEGFCFPESMVRIEQAPNTVYELGIYESFFGNRNLPNTGDFSPSWFKNKFPLEPVRSRLQRVIDQHGYPKGSRAAQLMLFHDVLGFMTEWGAGTEALSIQEGVRHDLKILANGTIHIVSHNIDEYGNLHPQFISFDKLPRDIGIGLGILFGDMFTLPIGEGRLIFSAQDLYEKDYDSPGDVLNPMFVSDISQDNQGNRVVSVTSWYLFTNRKLTPEERKFIVELLSQDENNQFPLDPISLVKNPLPARLSNFSYREDGRFTQETIKAFAQELDELFYPEFGRRLLAPNREDRIVDRIINKINERIEKLFRHVLQGNETSLWTEIYNMSLSTQLDWGIYTGLDPFQYIDDLINQRISILGFHPSNGENLDQYWDPIKQEWVGGDECKPETKKTCKLCKKKYEGENCPNCS